jgi:Nitroreductase
MGTLPDPLQYRQPAHKIQELFLKRWSPRSFRGEGIPQETLNELFEAARWAPSSYNEQEWRFLYAHRDTPEWDLFFNLLVEGNQVWCAKAAVLILVLSRKTFTRNGKPNPVHSLDTGMAVQNLFLEAASRPDLFAHGMAGYDRGKARATLQIPDDFETECMIAVGRPGDPDDLPETLRAGEIPSGRNPIEAFARPGVFRFDK